MTNTAQSVSANCKQGTKPDEYKIFQILWILDTAQIEMDL